MFGWTALGREPLLLMPCSFLMESRVTLWKSYTLKACKKLTLTHFELFCARLATPFVKKLYPTTAYFFLDSLTIKGEPSKNRSHHILLRCICLCLADLGEALQTPLWLSQSLTLLPQLTLRSPVASGVRVRAFNHKLTILHRFGAFQIRKNLKIARLLQNLRPFYQTGRILPSGEVALGRVCACSLRNRLVYLKLYIIQIDQSLQSNSILSNL